MKCGCFATQHRLAGSCIDCGRIICEEENPSFCPFCSSQNVLPVLTAEDAAQNNMPEDVINAYKLKVIKVT